MTDAEKRKAHIEALTDAFETNQPFDFYGEKVMVEGIEIGRIPPFYRKHGRQFKFTLSNDSVIVIACDA